MIPTALKILRVSALTILILGFSSASAQQKDQYQQKISLITKQITSITKSLNTDKAQLRTERDELLKEESSINRLTAQIVQNEDFIQRKKKEITDITNQQGVLLQKSKTDRFALQTLIRQRYMQGKSHYLKMLLDQKNPYAVGRLQHYYDYFQQAQQQKLVVLQKQLKELELFEVRLDRQKFELQEKRKNQIDTRLLLADSQKKREQSVRKLSVKIEQSSNKLRRLKDDRARLKKLLEQLIVKAEELKKIEEQKNRQLDLSRGEQSKTIFKGGFLKQKGRLKAPVQGVLKVKYGARLLESGMRSEGVLFNTKQPRPVHSIFRGQVLFADFLKGYGLLIIVDHGDQHISLYGHNELLYKKVGDMVNTDEVISKSGTTGGLREPGLYFEVRKNATPVDPAKWCQL